MDKLHGTAPSFWREYKKLPKELRRIAHKQYRLLRENPHHPSLRFKEVNSKKKLWSARVSYGYRAIALKRDDRYIWFWIGSHALYDRLIK